MLHEFQHWWFEQLAGLVPPRLRDLARSAPDAIVIDLETEAIALSIRRRGRYGALGRFGRDAHGLAAVRKALAELRVERLGLALRVAPDGILRKTVILPVAARANLGEVLAFEMGRETPFEESEVLWNYAIRHQDRDTSRMTVELALLPRAWIAEVVEVVEDSGLRLAAIEVDGPEATYRMTLEKGSGRKGEHAGRAAALLAGLTSVLLLIAVALPFLRQQRDLDQLSDAIDAVETETKAVLALKKEIAQLSNAATFLAEERAHVANPLATLAAATRAIPDDSYVTEFVLRGDRLTLVGASPSAASLIGKLAATKPFHDPAFAAPVVRPDGGKLELFTIGAAVGAGDKTP